MTRSLVSVGWLAKRLLVVSHVATPTSPRIQVIDSSSYLPGNPRSAIDEFTARRIPSAQFFDIDANSDPNSDLPHMLPTTKQFATAMTTMGVSNEDHVIVYDCSDEGMFSSARLWWMLRVFGHNRVSVLDGGFNKWVEEHHELDLLPPKKTSKEKLAPFEATPPLQQLLISHETMKSHSDGDNFVPPFQVIDARGRKRFNGETPEPRAGLRGGHMPNAISIPFTSVLDPASKTMLSPSSLQKVFTEAGVDPSKSIVASCGSGVTACVLALAMDNSNLGGPPVAVYDGSWTQWASDLECPVVKCS